MLRNYIITIYRNFKRERLFTILNLSGLALGLGCMLVIFKIITYEKKFDKHQSNYNDIYRIVRESIISTGVSNDASVSHPTGQGLRTDFPDLVVAMTHYTSGKQIAVERMNGVIDRFDTDQGLVYAESTVFSIFDFDFIYGDPATCLDQPNAMVLSRSRAKQFFNLSDAQLTDAIGKEVIMENKVNYQVVGLVEDFVETTDFPFNIFLNYQSLGKLNRHYGDGQNWGSNSSSTNCYFKAPSNFDLFGFEEALVPMVDKYFGERASAKLTFVAQPLSDIHYSEIYSNYPERTISMELIFSLQMIGVFLILTAAINFINLTTAQSIKRSKEIGIRKTLGGKSSQLALQFLSETLVVAIISAGVGLMVAELLLIYLEDILGYKLALQLFSEPMTLMFLAVNVLAIAILAGIYPAISMSRLQPIVALRAKFNTVKSAGFLSFRRVLVVTQFIITQVLIVGTLVISQQMDYFLNKDLGFDQTNVLLTYLPDNDESTLKRLKTTLLADPDILNITYGMSAPMGTSNSFTNIHHRNINDEEEEVRVNFKSIDEDYFDMYKLELIAGKSLVKKDTAKILINRKLAESLGFDDPFDALGEKISGWFDQMEVVGVVEDFHYNALHSESSYLAFIHYPNLFFEMAIKLNKEGKTAAEMEELQAKIKNNWEMVYPKDIYDFDYLQEQVNSRYEEEQKIGSMFQIFSVIAILIGCLGLYGLISYVANKKTKEIGIRKVMGASVMNVVTIFSKEMIGLVLFAFVFSGPVAYVIMDQWLSDFAYRIDLDATVFLIAITISMGVAIITAGYKAITAAMSNPVLSLKNE